jgi:uncharacterized integral membrane protein
MEFFFLGGGHFKELICYEEKKTLFIPIILMSLLDNRMFIFLRSPIASQALVQTLPEYLLIIEEGCQSI